MSSHVAPRQVKVIGIGAGSPGHLTQEAIAALRSVDVFLVADKGAAKDELVSVRRALCAQFIDGTEGEDYRFVTVTDPVRGPDAERDDTAYRSGVADWHAARADRYADVIADLPVDAVVGFLVWGDPAFYDSTIRVVDAIGERLPIDTHVVPGISAFQALAAAHGIARAGDLPVQQRIAGLDPASQARAREIREELGQDRIEAAAGGLGGHHGGQNRGIGRVRGHGRRVLARRALSPDSCSAGGARAGWAIITASA